MNDSILAHFAEAHSGFLHGAGMLGTDHLISILQITGNERVLEIGFGTGASLVRWKSLYPGSMILGVERSAFMRDKAKLRLKCCGLSDVPLHLEEHTEQLPFPDQHFDIIFIESVLGLLEYDQIKAILQEIHRLLKPGGQLGLNETIWLADSTAVEIERINSLCLQHYGIIQSCGALQNVEAWQEVIRNSGLEVTYCAKAEDRKAQLPQHWKDWMSSVFTQFGKLKQLLSRQHRVEKKLMDGLEKTIFSDPKPYLNSYIITAVKGE